MNNTSFISSAKTQWKPIDNVLRTNVNKAFEYIEKSVKELSETYEKTICNKAGKYVSNKELRKFVKTLLKILPIAAAILILANPISLTSGFIGHVLAAGLILAGAPDLFSDKGKIKLCQGASLAGGLYSLMEAVKIVAFGLSWVGALTFLGGLAFSAVFYYASEYKPGGKLPVEEISTKIKELVKDTTTELVQEFKEIEKID